MHTCARTNTHLPTDFNPGRNPVSGMPIECTLCMLHVYEPCTDRAIRAMGTRKGI